MTKGAELTPSKNFDSMSSKFWALGVLVDTGLVGEEILVYSESSFNWAMGQDLFLNRAGHHGVDGFAVIFRPLDSCLVALGRGFRFPAGLVVGGVDVVLFTSANVSASVHVTHEHKPNQECPHRNMP